MKLTHPLEVQGFVKSIFMLEEPCDEDRAIELYVLDYKDFYRVVIYFTYEINSYGECKRTNMDFKWLKTEPIEKLDEYVREAIDEINQQDINYK